MKKNLIHFFAVIGFGTFILLACSVDDIADSMNNNNNNNNSQIVSNNYGKYQITSTTSGSNNGNRYVYGLNTETGEVVRVSDPNNHTFTH
tara:strand:+ start:256 stop:525 length:270 start_codon:yes stop_codon:yes gene_type:complete